MNVLFVREKRTTVLGELSGEEAELLVQVNARNHNWEALFKYLQILPARSIASAARAMKQAGYDSDDPDRHALLARLYTLVDEVGDAPAGTRVLAPLGPVLRSWCDRGEGQEFQARKESDLRALLNEETPPPDQLAAMAALAKKGKLTANDLAECAKSPHWMVRIACSAFGGPQPASEPGGSLWIERLAPVLDAEAVWGGKPCDVTRDGLEVLQEGLAGLPNRRFAGGLNLVAAVAAHYVAHDIEIDIGAHVLVTEHAIEIEG